MKYIQALTALEYLLDKAKENEWRDWLRKDIELWKSHKDAWHHLFAYGAMGSFNDVWICVENQHNVTKAQEPWVNKLFEILKSVCFQLAQNPEKDVALIDVNSNRYVRIFGEIINKFTGKGMDNVAIQISKTIAQVQGWRCLRCGYGEINSYNIEDYLAKVLLPKLLKNAKTEQKLKALVDSAFTIEFDGVDEKRKEIKQLILNSDIRIIDREGWMRPCPNCSSDNTAVYRWELKEKLFTGSKDNLPLKNAA